MTAEVSLISGHLGTRAGVLVWQFSFLAIRMASAAVLAVSPLHAAVFCPANSAELAVALDISASNGESDQIRLRGGSAVYESLDQNGFLIRAERGRSLSISGRWAGFFMPCEVQLFVHPSGIAANSSQRGKVLVLDYSEGFDEDIYISDLILSNGYSDGREGACLDAVIPLGHGDLILDRVWIYECNHAGERGAALRVLNYGVSSVLIRNSIVTRNTTTGPALVLAAASADAVVRLFNNTIVGNSFHLDGPFPAVQVSSWAGGQFGLFNNVIVENGASLKSELELSGPGIAIHHNVLDSFYTGQPSVESGTQILDGARLFEDFPTDLRPRALSALRDAGSDLESSWAGSLDVSRAPRLQNQRLDVGAYEGEGLHADGFE